MSVCKQKLLFKIDSFVVPRTSGILPCVPCHLVSKPFRHISIVVERKHRSSSRQFAQKIITCRICLYGSFKDLNQPNNVDTVNLFLWKLKAFPHDLFIQRVRSYSWINSYVTESNLGLLIDQNEVTKHVWMFGSNPPPPPPTSLPPLKRTDVCILQWCYQLGTAIFKESGPNWTHAKSHDHETVIAFCRYKLPVDPFDGMTTTFGCGWP